MQLRTVMMTVVQKISEKALFDTVLRAIPDADLAKRALHATLATLGSRLTMDEAEPLRARLPDPLAILLDDVAGYDSDFDAAELYWRAAQRMGAPLGVAHEYVDVVVRALGAELDADVRGKLARALPEAIAHHLTPEEGSSVPPHASRRLGDDAPLRTLASGRPGSTHPIATATSVREGHTQSVARSANPHADTKLSSTHGLTQERFDETLAAGHGPTPARPVSEVTDERPRR